MEAYQLTKKVVWATGTDNHEWGVYGKVIGDDKEKYIILHTIHIDSKLSGMDQLMKFIGQNSNKDIYFELNGDVANFSLNGPKTLEVPPGEVKSVLIEGEPANVIGLQPLVTVPVPFSFPLPSSGS